jgi:hypothetical protein
MNARTKKVEGNHVGLHVISCRGESHGVQPGRWTRIKRTLGRIGLLMVSPVASFRWARAKRNARYRQQGIPGIATGRAKPRRVSGLAECANDGIVMGY